MTILIHKSSKAKLLRACECGILSAKATNWSYRNDPFKTVAQRHTNDPILASSVTAPVYQVTQRLRNSSLMTNYSDSYFGTLPSTAAETDAAGLG